MKEHKKFGFFLLLQLLFFAFFFLYSRSILRSLDQDYKEQELDTVAILVNEVSSTHPELTESLVYTLLTEQGDIKEARALLASYGLSTGDQLGNLDRIDQTRKALEHNFLVGYFVFFLFFFLTAIHYAYSQKKEIRKMASYLDKVLNGNYNLQVKEYSDGDLELLANNIFKITTLLKEKKEHANQGKEQLESVLSDISHQLKTPLTSMYVMNDLLKNDQLSPEKKKELLRKNHAQLERIEWLVTTLLKMSRLDSGMVEMKKEEVRIAELVESALEPLRIPIELKKQQVILEGDPEVTFLLDPHWTREAFVNILKNAYEHTEEEGTLTVTWEENPLYLLLEIKDTGIGIKKEELPYIFDRFYKGSGNKESIGIGLNMSKTIIQKQNGVIVAFSKEGKGTTFSIKFYKNVV